MFYFINIVKAKTIIVVMFLFLLSFLLVISNTMSMHLEEGDESWDNYLQAWLQSTGIAPQNDEFMRNYYENIYDISFGSTSCYGCYIKNICIECIDQDTCELLKE